MTALALATIAGLPLGVIAGSGRAPAAARIVHAGSLVALSLPPLLTSLVFAWTAARTGWFPIGGISSAAAADLSFIARGRDLAWHLVLPSLALALPLAATFERLQADAVSAVRAEPFILGALSRGIPADRVIWRDVWRPALGPVLSIHGIAAGQAAQRIARRRTRHRVAGARPPDARRARHARHPARRGLRRRGRAVSVDLDGDQRSRARLHRSADARDDRRRRRCRGMNDTNEKARAFSAFSSSASFPAFPAGTLTRAIGGVLLAIIVIGALAASLLGAVRSVDAVSRSSAGAADDAAAARCAGKLARTVLLSTADCRSPRTAFRRGSRAPGAARSVH